VSETSTAKTQDRKSTDQVSRVVDQYFKQRNGELLIGNIPISALAKQFGTPSFIYDKSIIQRKIEEVHNVLPNRFNLYYSIKANPNQSILKCFLDKGCGLEIASQGELSQALQSGCISKQIIFAGPGKTFEELKLAVQSQIGEIHVESIDEAHQLNSIGESLGLTVPIALRINPTDSSGGAMQMGGKPSPFGIDEESIDDVCDTIKTLRNIRMQGVHLFMGTQILDAKTLEKQYRRCIAIARFIAKTHQFKIETIDFGGGWGTPYFPHENELDLRHLKTILEKIDTELSADELLSGCNAVLEPGRFLINEAGVYLTQVTRVKKSRGKTFVILDGGMHHHLAASGNLGQTIKRNYPIAILNRLSELKTHSAEVVGPLCTPLDCLGRNVQLPKVEVGDLFGVFLSGAYARTSSPTGFLSHLLPPEILVDGENAALIRRRGNSEDFLQDQIAPTLPNPIP